MSASSSMTTSMPSSLSSSKELCINCQTQPYDIICTCGDKFDFTCLHVHVEQMGFEFQFLQVDVGQRLLSVEQTVEDDSCTNASTIIENWRRKRIADINDIADAALNPLQERDKAYSSVPSFRVDYNSLCQVSHHVGHEQLNSMIALQRQIYEKSDEFKTLPELIRDDNNLDSQLQSKLNPNISNQNESMSFSKNNAPLDTDKQMNTESITLLTNTSIPKNIESSNSIPTTPLTETPTNNTKLILPSLSSIASEKSMDNVEAVNSTPTIPVNENSTDNVEPIDSTPTVPSNAVLTVNQQPTLRLTNNATVNNSSVPSLDHDEFEAGQTTIIERRNPIIISANNDRFASTICCHENQLLYNDYNPRGRSTRITLIPDITQTTNKRIIDWDPAEVLVGGGDDDWVQDITYSTKINGYLLLNRSRLRFLPKDTYQFEEFYQFPDRSMKRVACNDSFIYLVSACGITGQNGDEIILMNYDKEEKVCKRFRDLVLRQSNQMPGPLLGEISDISVNRNGQVLFSYRYARREEVGVCMFNISNNGNDWTQVKRFLLNECWHNDLSYTPRLEWCEKLNVFFLIEYMTSHLIILDLAGQVKGETRFSNVQTRRDGPLNLSISNNDWLSVRYESSINIHRLDDDRL